MNKWAKWDRSRKMEIRRERGQNCPELDFPWRGEARLSDVNVENVEVGTKWLTNCTAMTEIWGRGFLLITPASSAQVFPSGFLCILPRYWVRQVTGEILVLLNQVLWWSVEWCEVFRNLRNINMIFCTTVFRVIILLWKRTGSKIEDKKLNTW